MRTTALGILAALLALAAWPAAGQRLEKGALLAASSDVSSYAFARSIVLVVHHDDNGSLGLIVNRPTELRPAEAFEALDDLGDYEGRVFVGGPLEPARPLLLFNDPEGFVTDADPVLGSIHIAADPALARRHAEQLGDETALRVYAGHVQWEPGQLESEIADGAWRVLAGSAEAVFSNEPLELYREVSTDDGAAATAATVPGLDLLDFSGLQIPMGRISGLADRARQIQ